jgi:hypothetical protein
MISQLIEKSHYTIIIDPVNHTIINQGYFKDFKESVHKTILQAYFLPISFHLLNNSLVALPDESAKFVAFGDSLVEHNCHQVDCCCLDLIVGDINFIKFKDLILDC